MFIEENHTSRQCTIRGVITGFEDRTKSESTRSRWGHLCLRVAALFLLLQSGGFAFAQFHHRAKARPAPPSASLTFMMRDGTCVDGPISNITPKAVTVQPLQKPPVTILRADLLQVTQEDAVLFSARSSWSDVETVQLSPHESFTVKTRKGQLIQGRPLSVSDKGLVYKWFLWLKKRYPKDQIVAVDYLRMKPASPAFDYFTQEAPALLFFYPEFYDRLAGLEGHVPVRLYDVLLHEDNAPLKCAQR
jgi:hypothetical protein